MFSNDRRPQLELTLSCLRQMKGYDKCQKTLVVDGRLDEKLPEDFEYVQVPRINNNFCWGKMWDAGVGSARFSKILYLDSDRLLPSDYLEKVESNVQDHNFVFTSLHFLVLNNTDIQICYDFLKQNPKNGLFQDERFQMCFGFEVRHQTPLYGPGKNAMSGNTAFTKKTYWELGGVDHWYCGHGAYADTDFQMMAIKTGCSFTDLKAIELHYHHLKLNDDNATLKDQNLKYLALQNFVYYSKKWQLPPQFAENLAKKSQISKEKLNRLLESVKVDAKEFERIKRICL